MDLVELTKEIVVALAKDKDSVSVKEFPTDEENTNHIKKSIKKQLSDEVYNKTKIFHLRGAIYYSKLDVKHKIMMKLLYNKAKNIREEEQTPEIKAMIETYNKEADFVDFNTLDSIINEL